MKPHQRSRSVRRQWSCWYVLVSICAFGCVGSLTAQSTNELVAVVQQDGTISLPGSAEVPPYPTTGQWTEAPGKTSERYVTRHFLFMVPKHVPAMEFFPALARSGEKTDGVFEIGLVRGYVTGFAGRGGFKADDPVFEDCVVGSAKAKRCRVKLSRDQRVLWIYAYIYIRQPSLTFLSVRPDSDAQPTIERYLATVWLK